MASNSTTTTTKLPSSATLLSAQQTLRSTLPLLNGTAHRHKNQHRMGRWWSQFMMLRKHVRKLVGSSPDARPISTGSGNPQRNPAAGDDDGEIGVAITAAKRRERPSKKAKPVATSNVKPEPALERARWMRRWCVPSSYLAFTQLAADNQFAQIGLLLLGVLAQVDAALALMLGDESDPDGPATLADTKDPSQAQAEASRSEDRGVAVVDDDIGEALSRADFEVAKAETGGSRAAETELVAQVKRPAAVPDLDEEIEVPVKKAKTKKKKKTRARDEFDDMFASLE